MGSFGKRQVRVEDEALVRGHGRYIDDIHIPGMVHVVLVRSTVAHAELRGIDAAAARAAPGVVSVVTADDLPEAARILPDGHPNAALQHPQLARVLAFGRVRYVGEPIAAVVATDPYLAEDAAELVAVDYAPLPAVVDLEGALGAGAHLVHDDMTSNVAARIAIAKGEAAKAFADAAHVVAERVEIHRGAGQAMETRGIVANWNAAEGRMEVWNVSQVPYVHREIIAAALGLPEHCVQVLNGDVGGGFGYKGLTYAEDVLIPVIARRIERPVKWIEDRREHLIASYHERSQLHELEMAVDAEGVIIGIRGRFLHDTGAYSPWGPVVPLLTLVNIPGPYKVPHYDVEALMIYMNRVPATPVRGAGRPQAVYAMERLLDAVARRTGINPVEVRRRNLIQADEYPYKVGFVSRDGTQRTYDSGNVPALLERALELVHYDDHRRKQAELREQGRYIGLGVACCVEEGGLGPFEEVALSIEVDGSVTVRMGTPSQGQGQKTIFAQIAAGELGVPIERVRIFTGNTDNVRHSIGTFASRAAIVTGSATLEAAKEMKARACRIGGIMLQAGDREVELADGCVRVKSDPSRSVSLSEIVKTTLGNSGGPLALMEFGPGMTVIGSFCPSAAVFSGGAHAAVVEVDPRTGKVSVLDYAAVEDFGNVANPLVVDGQVIGGVAHGIGNTFLERVEYDDEGQILTGTLMDYLMPTTMDVPRISVDYIAAPSPLNPLGMKGAGQGGVIPVPAVLTCAVENALEPFGVHLTRVPFSESDLLELIDDAARAGAEAAS